MPTRRDILRLITAASLVRRPLRMKVEARPPRALMQGATVGIVAPAGPVELRQLKRGIDFFESLGLRVVLGRFLNSGSGYLAAPDRDRAAELMEFLLRPDIDAVIAARGGYGVLRILPALDYTALEQCNKPVIGYSDITALLVTLYQRTGLITFHGPMASSQFDTTTAGSFLATLFRFASERSSPTEMQLTYSDASFLPVVSGVAEGILLGGNLSVFCSLLGTPFEPDTRECILFFEDVGEEPYKVDRMLTQLALAGKFDGIRGMVLGAFSKQSPRAIESTGESTGTAIADIAAEHCARRGIPLLANFPIGHIESKITLPIGCRARLDAQGRTLQILEAPVTLAR
jgi:muramoyltetrapeptide carboxypeptidase